VEDKQLISLLFDRAEKAIEALAQRFGGRLYQTAMNILGIHQDAEESVSDTYLALWNAIPPKRPEPLAPFVYRTGRNIALKRVRDASAQKRCSAYDISLSELEGCIAGPDLWEQLDGRALGRAMDAFLDTLSRENRVIFLRRYWFGDTVAEVGAAMGMTENAVSVRLSRLRDKLKAYLIKEGFYDA